MGWTVAIGVVLHLVEAELAEEQVGVVPAVLGQPVSYLLDEPNFLALVHRTLPVPATSVSRFTDNPEGFRRGWAETTNALAGPD